mmetsp:Transcript_15954/g.41993  ORF Transcript_15954/g.41993 Transcript_15954/m.41993 type:complete len:549 (-) Transcript_15954:277-1923(-)
MSLVADALSASLLPSPTQRLLGGLCDVLQLCLSLPLASSGESTLPSEAAAALRALDASLSLSLGAPPADAPLAAMHAAYRADFLRDFGGEGGRTKLPELVAKLDAWRSRLELALATAGAPAPHLDEACWQLLSWSHPLVELPGQYVGHHAGVEPPLEQHVHVDRFSAAVTSSTSAATGHTVRVVSMHGDDSSVHSFALRVDTPLRPHDGLHLERFSQLACLLNRRLLKSREARRRALMLHASPAVRLGGGLALVPLDRAAGRASLDGVLVQARSDGGLRPHEPTLNFYKALARNALTDAEPAARAAKLKEAYADACGAVGDDVLSSHMARAMPSPAELWALQRRLASQLGLHALLCHALRLRATHPSSLVLRRDHAAVEYEQFDMPRDRAPLAASSAMPFRLTRNLIHLISPLGVDGGFAGAFSAAAECMAQRRKCPLGQWLDLLSRPEDPDDDGAGAGRADAMDVDGAPPPAAGSALVPWGALPADAIAAVSALSPELAVQRKADNKGLPPGKATAADVHAGLRALIDEATDADKLQAMPPAWQPWL